MNTTKPLDANIRSDLSASLVVFLVALPLCLGISLASNAPLSSGLLSGVIGGLVVTVFSGSALSVSGPAAGLAVICADAIHQFGSFEKFLVAVVIAGLFQIVFGILKMGILGEYVPTSVIKGMLAGIGVVIILKQIPHALGRDADFQGDLGFFQQFDQNNSFTAILRAIESASFLAVAITVCSLLILFSYDRFLKGWRFAPFIPAPLLVVLFGSISAAVVSIFAPEFALQRSGGHYVELPILQSLAAFKSLPTPDLTLAFDASLILTGLTIAIVASLETLLSIEAVDKLDPYRRISPTSRELIAQGVGNTAAGLLGGLPITAVIVRSSANIYAGGKTKLSAFAHGILLLLATLTIPHFLNYIPLCSLATILIYVGYKLASVKIFRDMYRIGQDQFLPFIVTVIGIVFTDLLTGVLIGLAFGLFYVLKLNHHNCVTLVQDGSDYLLRFNKDVSFLNKMEVKEALSKIKGDSSVVIDGTKAMYIDRDIYDVMADFEHNCTHRAVSLQLRNIEGKMLPLFRKKAVLKNSSGRKRGNID